MAPSIIAPSPALVKSVTYDRLERCYRAELDGRIIGYYKTDVEAHSTLNALVFELLSDEQVAAADDAADAALPFEPTVAELREAGLLAEHGTAVVLNREEGEYEVWVDGELMGAEPTREAAEAALKAITSATPADPALLIEYKAGDCGLMSAGKDDLALAIGSHCLPVDRAELLALRELLALPGVVKLLAA